MDHIAPDTTWTQTQLASFMLNPLFSPCSRCSETINHPVWTIKFNIVTQVDIDSHFKGKFNQKKTLKLHGGPHSQ